MVVYGVTLDTAEVAIALGIAVSMLFYEKQNLIPGGVIVPGYVAITLDICGRNHHSVRAQNGCRIRCPLWKKKILVHDADEFRNRVGNPVPRSTRTHLRPSNKRRTNRNLPGHRIHHTRASREQHGETGNHQNDLCSDNRLRHHVRNTLRHHRKVIMLLVRSTEKETQKSYTDNSCNNSARNSLDFCPAGSFIGQYHSAPADRYHMGYRATAAGLQSDPEQVYRAHTWKLH